MSAHFPVTMVMVDDSIDEVFLTRRQVRTQGIVNHFVSERKPENLIGTLIELYNQDPLNNILVLLDINMPRMSGFETLREVREHPQFGDIPVVMFSASGDQADIAEAASLGANGYIVKPFTMDAFIAALGKVPKMKYCLVQ
jgi:CheY-like chemotaxis protein